MNDERENAAQNAFFKLRGTELVEGTPSDRPLDLVQMYGSVRELRLHHKVQMF